MRLFVVLGERDYEGTNVLGVFSTEALAIQGMKDHYEQCRKAYADTHVSDKRFRYEYDDVDYLSVDLDVLR